MAKMIHQKLALQIAISAQLTRGINNDCPPLHIMGGVGIGKTKYLEWLSQHYVRNFIGLSASQIIPEFIRRCCETSTC